MVAHNHPSLTLSEACRILAHRRRRQLLSYLSTKDTDVADFNDLVTHLTEKSDDAMTTEQVQLSLNHTHIPKLVDYGVIEYDRRNKDVRYRDGTKLEDLLEIVSANPQSA